LAHFAVKLLTAKIAEKVRKGREETVNLRPH